MTDLITANPNLRGVFASNLIMAEGAGQAMAENKKADTIKMIGFDSDDKTVGLLKDGTIYGLVVQDPYRMGYDGVKTALAASKGDKVEANVDTGANLITKANMDGEKQHALLSRRSSERMTAGAPPALSRACGAPLGRRAIRPARGVG